MGQTPPKLPQPPPECYITPPGRRHRRVPAAFADVIAALWHPDSSEAVNPGRFKAVFQKYVPSFTGYR